MLLVGVELLKSWMAGDGADIDGLEKSWTVDDDVDTDGPVMAGGGDVKGWM